MDFRLLRMPTEKPVSSKSFLNAFKTFYFPDTINNPITKV